MKKNRFFVELLFVVLSFVLVPTAAKAALWEVPAGLNPGDTFRWVFVTSTTTHALSSAIDDYNAFVNAAADAAGTPISGVVGASSIADVQWKAIASTGWGFVGDDAIDNIGVSPEGIYTPWGVPVAYGTPDLFSGSILAPILVDEYGSPTTDHRVWTGTTTSGVGDGQYELGSFLLIAAIGDASASDGLWVYAGALDVFQSLPLYAISEPLTVVPVPGAVLLAATGLLSSALGLKRLRRKRQE